MQGLEIVGVDMHIGSQLTRVTPVADAVARVVALVKALRERTIEIRMVDIGGGLGIRYREETPPTHEEYATVLLPALREAGATVLLEPGRSIAGNAGILLTRVLYRKDTGAKKFVVIDAAMNDLIRPALYGAWHEVKGVRESESGVSPSVYDIVGPVCESADFLAKDRRLAAAEGDLLAIMSCGAYAMAMSSNYNTRPRAAEVLVKGGETSLVRRRESVEDLFALERTKG
jgi:diaminopimelate decarboxylase